MQTLKPRCDGCGTANAIDAEYCMECGIKFVSKSEESLKFETDGNFVIRDDDDSDTVLWNYNGINKINPPCTHKTVVGNHQCQCVRCIDCDTRTETCEKHIPKFDYGLDIKIKNSLDHLRNNLRDKGKFKSTFVEDKKLDFRSLQIPDWEFRKEFMIRNDEDIAKHGIIEGRNVLKVKAKNLEEAVENVKWDTPPIPTETMKPPLGGIIKMPNSTPEQVKHFKEAYKGEMEKVAKDPNYIPLIATNKDIEIIPFSTTSNLNPQPPYSAITGTDVRKGIPPQKPEPTQIPISSGLNRPFPARHVRKPWGGGKCNCDGIKSMCDEFRAKQKPPQSAVIGLDVRKGFSGASDDSWKYIFLVPLMTLFVTFIYTLITTLK